jgi:cob(I)alamin adenosyltransferase
MKIYTKTGDDGSTGLLGSRRVPKDDARIEAYGTIDELNAVLGIARSLRLGDEIDSLAGQLQDELFSVGSALADPNPDGPFHAAIGDAQVARLESAIDILEAELPPLTRFILPGGTSGAAMLHLARTVCRRAERQVVRLGRTPGEQVPARLLVYLNRLSDLLFLLARAVNHRHGRTDVLWEGPGG